MNGGFWFARPSVKYQVATRMGRDHDGGAVSLTLTCLHLRSVRSDIAGRERNDVRHRLIAGIRRVKTVAAVVGLQQ